jgi:hypothetical protein
VKAWVPYLFVPEFHQKGDSAGTRAGLRQILNVFRLSSDPNLFPPTTSSSSFLRFTRVGQRVRRP